MNYTHSYTNKIEIINKIPEVLPGMISTDLPESNSVDRVLRPASITGTGVLEWIWYWPDTDIHGHITKIVKSKAYNQGTAYQSDLWQRRAQ